MGYVEKTLVSVIMPAYNAERYIQKSIQSVQNQSFHKWELIVIDDCSTDNTVAVVTEAARSDNRIHVYVNEQNSGVAKTRNRGLELSKGKYIAFLDSDDVWIPQKLEIQLNRLTETGADMIYTSYAIVNEFGEKQCADFIVPDSISFSGLLKENVIGCSTVLLNRERISDIRFEEQFYHEDYVLWLQLLQSGHKIIGEKHVLVDYYFHTDSKAGNKLNAAEKRWQIYRKHLGLSTVESLWYFAHYALAGMRKYKEV